jgi:transcription elongation factor Elf1
MEASMEAIRFQCPNCGHKLKSNAQTAGKQAVCSNCKCEVVIPETSTARDHGSGEFGLAALSVEEMNRDELRQLRAEVQREIAAASGAQRSRSRREAYYEAPEAEDETHVARSDGSIVKPLRLALRTLAWLYVIYYFFVLFEVALGIRFLGGTPLARKELDGSGTFFVLVEEILTGATIICMLTGFSELLRIAGLKETKSTREV